MEDRIIIDADALKDSFNKRYLYHPVVAEQIGKSKNYFYNIFYQGYISPKIAHLLMDKYGISPAEYSKSERKNDSDLIRVIREMIYQECYKAIKAVFEE